MIKLQKISFCISFVFFFAFSLSAQTKSYYISSTGNDANDGLTKAAAWQSATKINAIDLQPGDSVFFEGGQTFTGPIQLQADDVGMATKPIVITSYGSGKAMIEAFNQSGIFLTNAGGVELRNLVLKGDGQGYTNNGLTISISQTSTDIDYLFIDEVEVSGFGGRGLLLGSDGTAMGFNNITIQNSQFHDNGIAGIETYGNWPAITHSNLKIAYCKAYNNYGQPITSNNTGNGIVVSGFNGGVIEYSEAYNNGQNNAGEGGGPVGIWVYDTKNITIQFCESHHNKAGRDKDGGGFDIDGGSENCIIQYCYSHDNEGPGYALVEFGSPNVFTNNIIRYNISQNDGRKNGYGALIFYGEDNDHRISNCQVYNNTFYVNGNNLVSGKPSAVEVISNFMDGISVKNNIFYIEPGVNMLSFIEPVTTANIHFQNNNYYSVPGNYSFIWNGTTYSSLQQWKSIAAGQEMNGSVSLGSTHDPLLEDAGSGGLVRPADKGSFSSLMGYRLKSTSPMINSGKEILNMGNRDFFGIPVPYYSSYDIGAAEAFALSVLPVGISDFYGTADGNKCLLVWKVAHESNLSYYEVEYSTDGIHFKTVGSVIAEGKTEYQFVHRVQFSEGLYYRIKNVFRGSEATYSKIIFIGKQHLEKAAIFYNESTGLQLHIFSEAKSQTGVYIFNAGGSLVYSTSLSLQRGDNTVTITDALKWSAGIYFVQFTKGQKAGKFVKPY
ncbi:MAG TPA: right-handed parallel beta-helix repeat-containing protein [Flavisolibacter sp.]|nr:right-handed parallel beta-helix repeat-containing protein [Flavisolibacter sp.]